MTPEVEATVLLASGRPSLADVWCGEHKHRLGRVYELPDRGPVLALGQSLMLEGSLLPDTDTPLLEVGYKARLVTLDDEIQTCRRCHCGTWFVSVKQVRRQLGLGGRVILASRWWPRRGDAQHSA